MNKYRYKNKTLEINIYKYKCVQNSPPFYEKSGDSFSENYYQYMYFNLNSHNSKEIVRAYINCRISLQPLFDSLYRWFSRYHNDSGVLVVECLLSSVCNGCQYHSLRTSNSRKREFSGPQNMLHFLDRTTTKTKYFEIPQHLLSR